ncbi:MAG: TonB family protein [Gemmatimonadota bacterium]|jgi:TonB family protein
MMPRRLLLLSSLVACLGVGAFPRPAQAQLRNCCVRVPDGETGIQVDDDPRPTNVDAVLAALEQIAEDGANRGWPGRTALIWIHISERGGVLETRVSRGSGDQSLDRQLLAAAALFRFEPARVEGEPVDVWIELPMPVGREDVRRRPR